MQRNRAILGGNKFKLGLFAPNCSSATAFTSIPNRWEASWENNLKLAHLCDQIGIECFVPIARWKGYGGPTNPNGSTFETMTWACGLLAQTRHLNVFGTVHAPLIHPVLAAKQMVTVDHVSQGRFGLNIVCGWNQDEFEMFGVSLKDHDARYQYGQEWWDIIKLIWSGAGPVDYDGRFFQLKGLEGFPGPYGGRRPIMMNAGASPAGRAFAIRNSDLHFDFCEVPEAMAARVRETKQLARQHGHEIQVFTSASMVCRATYAEADEFLGYCVEHGDWEALDHLLGLFGLSANMQSVPSESLKRFRKEGHARALLGYGASILIWGDPDRVSGELARLAAAGFDGVALGFMNFLEELPFFAQEVIPRLERLGLRTAL
jgi:alkanesulfonate monooxygenase SsuD/methylene tetrahydromethanopterin reductase-like flavin-dependent oxidoreductase (luciferase family)